MSFFVVPAGMNGVKYCGYRGSVFMFGASAVVWIWHWRKRVQLRQKAIAKRTFEQEYISAQLKALKDELSDERVLEILKLKGSELLEKLRSGEIKPEEVVKVYVFKACQVTLDINCVTEVIKECNDMAAVLSEKNPADFPLYGLPVSLKESYKIKGAPCTAGFAMYLDDICKDDCVLAKVLKHCGAVPFVKTNLPQIMLSIESSNPIFGETSNPLNHDFSPSGSSAGESAIIAAGASVLGFGSDIAGSIRIPAHFTGICGLKATKNRLSGSGIRGALPGQTAISAGLGPMARDVDTLVITMRAILCDKMFELDKNVPPMKFNEELYGSKKRLRIGYYYDDGYMKPVPACQRAVKITKEALEKAGHVLVPYKVPDIELLMENATRAFYMDGGQTNLERLKHDVVDQRLFESWKRWRMPTLIRNLYAMLMRFQSTRMAKDVLAYGGGDKSVYQLWKLQAWVGTYAANFWEEWEGKYKINALICPVFPLVTCPKGMISNMTGLMSYTTPYTTVNCPAGTVTVTKVTPQDIEELKQHKGHYDDRWDRHCKKACLGSVDMPVGVQCVAPPWQEEVCLRLMKEVETLLGN